ncbi:MAG: CDP-glycerol glycerophosphotransferase family protein [Defluviitaleaceae bacterium]|nr:CDP-glycerol glycerophosphotransferase family protein [Defluviitaleaceae bacterium]
MREWIVFIYLFSMKILFTGFKLLPLTNKITFLVSFPDNTCYIYDALKQQKSKHSVIFLCHKRCFNAFKKTKQPTYLIETLNVRHTIIGLYHLATSKYIIADNYYGCLAVTTFKKEVSCIQVWHAVGAIKQFGAMDPSNGHRTPAAHKRFKKVYNRFDHIVIGSPFMRDIFKQAFLVKDPVFLKIGVPRTDFFFDIKKQKQVKHVLYEKNPLLKEKKVILYAPTFRRYAAGQHHIPLDIQKLYTTLQTEYNFLIKLHPNIKTTANLADLYPDFVFDYSDYHSINDLLTLTDILITDYTSIPMEFSLLKRRMIFYADDLEQYQHDNGLWEDYESSIPGPLVKNTDELITAVLHGKSDPEQLAAYAQKWTAYCQGDASEKLVNHLLRS